MKQKNDMGYDLAIDAATRITGSERGAAAWLAKELGISRQLLFSWKRSGFPRYAIPKIAKVAQLYPNDIGASYIWIKTRKEDWDSLAPKELKDQSTVMRKR